MPPKYQFKAGEVIKSGKVHEETLNQMKVWCSQQNFPSLSDEQLILFLISTNNKIEDAQTVILMYFTCKVKAPELFFNIDLERTANIYDATIISERTPENEAILIGRLKDTSYKNFYLEEMFKLAYTLLEFCLYKSPPNGLIVIVDMKDVGFLHLTKLRIGVIQTTLQFVQEALPCQIKQIHIVNTVSFIEKILFLIKPFVKKELLEAIRFHPRGADFDEIFRHLPKNCLPGDFSGSLLPLRIQAQETYKEIAQLMQTFYYDLEQQVKSFGKISK